MALKGLWNIIGSTESMTFIKIIDKIAKVIIFSKCGSKLIFLTVFYLDVDSYSQSKKQAICVSRLRLDVMFSHYPKCRIFTNSIHVHIKSSICSISYVNSSLKHINSKPVGKYSDLQHCMHGHDASLKYQALR